MAAPTFAASTSVPAAVTNPTAYVNPFIGTGSGGDVVGQVDTFPGADMPFGMVQWSPDTPSRPAGGGYNYTDSSITGFSLTHLSGPGCPVAGDVPFLPTVGAIGSAPGSTSEPFAHSSEQAAPGYYAVQLGSPAVKSELTTTTRTGLGQFTYPATAQANMLIEVANSANGNAGATLNIDGANEVEGSTTSGHFCGAPDQYTLYFDVQFSRPFAAHGTWNGSTVTPGAQQTAMSPQAAWRGHPQAARAAHGAFVERKGAQPRTQPAAASDAVSGGWVTFDTRSNPVVEMKVGVSYVSVANARANLSAENAGWDFQSLRQRASASWNQWLSKARVSGGTQAQLTAFYTALYHVLLHPNVFSDANGQYIGFDNKTHTLPHSHTQYANFSGWDIYRSEVPLLAMLAPDETSDMMQSLVNDGVQGGWLPKWPLNNGYTGVMNGDAADPIIAEAYAFGARNFDVRAALNEMLKGATDTTSAPGQSWYVERPSLADYLAKGYVPNTVASSISPVPNGASETLEYASDDFSIAQLAKSLGDSATYQRYLGRSQNWANVFDTATGYIEPRDADGAFPPGPPVQMSGGFGQSGFQEGNAAQYTWMNPQDLRALFDGIGGNSAVNARLNDFFSQLNVGPNAPYEWAGNEPNLGTPWEYNYSGAPWRTQATVREIATQLYGATPGGEPGNDDLGSMSSWYVWAALGLYPETAGTPVLVVGSPLFPEINLDLGYGRHLMISAPGASASTQYVQSLRVNNAATTKTWIDMSGQPGNAQLNFSLGSTPNTAWGSATNDAPPSFPAGPVAFPPSTRAYLFTNPARVQLAPGASTTVAIGVNNSDGASAATATWTATAPSGITLTPAKATGTAATGQSASTQVTVSAAASAMPGYYNVVVAGTAANGAILAHTTLALTVVKPGVTIPTAYVANYSDASVTPIDIATNVAGTPIGVGAGPNDVVVSPDGKTAYVANQNPTPGTVSVIDTATNNVTATIPAGNQPAGITITPDGKTVYVTDYGSGQVTPINTATNTVGAPITVGNNPETIVVSPDGSTAWVANQGSNSVSVIATASNTVTQTIAVGSQPYGVAITPDGSQALVTNGGSNNVTPVNAKTYAAGAPIPVGSVPQGVTISPDGTLAYVANFGGTTVTPISLPSDTPGAAITVGSGPYQIAFTPDGKTAYTVNTNSNDVTPIDVATGTTGTHIPVGNAPDGIAITPAMNG